MRSKELRQLNAIIESFDGRITDRIRAIRKAQEQDVYAPLLQALETLRPMLSEAIQCSNQVQARRADLDKLGLATLRTRRLAPGMLLVRQPHVRRSKRGKYKTVRLVAQSKDKTRWRCATELGTDVVITDGALRQNWQPHRDSEGE